MAGSKKKVAKEDEEEEVVEVENEEQEEVEEEVSGAGEKKPEEEDDDADENNGQDDVVDNPEDAAPTPPVEDTTTKDKEPMEGVEDSASKTSRKATTPKKGKKVVIEDPKANDPPAAKPQRASKSPKMYAGKTVPKKKASKYHHSHNVPRIVLKSNKFVTGIKEVEKAKPFRSRGTSGKRANSEAAQRLRFLTEYRHLTVREHGKVIISKAPFVRLVREITNDLFPGKEIRWQSGALAALLEDCDAELMELFSHAGMLLPTYLDRVTLDSKHFMLGTKLSTCDSIKHAYDEEPVRTSVGEELMKRQNSDYKPRPLESGRSRLANKMLDPIERRKHLAVGSVVKSKNKK